MQDQEQQHPPLHPDIFVGTSEMAELMRRHPWADTPLGPPERWPQALKVALRILLTSRFEMWLGWGPDIHFFYNDAYRPTLGAKHPRSLAMPTRELWAEIWDDIRERIEAVLQRGESTWDRGLLLILHRSGYPEETYHTFSYSPLIGDSGAVEGIFCVLAIRDQVVPPTLNLDDPDEGTEGVDLVPHKARHREVRAALSNSFGFGGTNASVIFKKVD